MKKQLFCAVFLLISISVFLTGALNVGPKNARAQKSSLVGKVSVPSVEHNEWLKVQVDPTLKDADKVACTIDTFFNLKYRSWVKLELLDFGFLFDRKNTKGADNYAYERGLYYLWLTMWREFNTPPNSIESYKYIPKYYQLSINKNVATVRVLPETLIVHSDSKDIVNHGPFTEHAFTLIRKGGLWLIRGVISTDEMRARFPHGTDFDEALKRERKGFLERQGKQDEEETELLNDPKLQLHLLQRRMLKKIREQGVAIPRPKSSRTFYPWKAAYYAQLHTSDTPGTGLYNPLFLCFDSDCQNFVSQCVWYGWGGISEVNHIENHVLPMIDEGVPPPYQFDWWADSTETASNNTWINVGAFISMITQNYTGNKVGVQGRKFMVKYVDIGDIVAYIGVPSHIMLVTSNPDLDQDGWTDFNEIYFSAHTNNRLNARLIDYYSSAYFYIITSFKEPE